MENWYEKKRMKMLNVYLSERDHQNLKIHCAKQNVSIANWVRVAIKEKMQADNEAKRREYLRKKAFEAKRQVEAELKAEQDMPHHDEQDKVLLDMDMESGKVRLGDATDVSHGTEELDPEELQKDREQEK